MPRYLFKQAVHIEKRDWPRGQHEVPEKVEYNPTFLRYVELGLIEEVHASQVISPETMQERQKKLHETLVNRRDKKKMASTPTEEKVASPTTEEKSEKKSDDHHHHDEKKAKSKR